jgi:hypothetical protein
VLLRVARALGLVLLLSTFGAVVASAQVSNQGSEPAAVITAYEMARNRGDIDAAVAFFADNAVISQRSTTFTGRDEIRRYLQNSTGRGRFVVVTNRKTNGNHVSWVERPAGQNVNGVEVAVEAIVRDGKIRALSYNSGAILTRLEPAVDGRAQLPAVVGLGSVVVVLSSVVLLASTGLGQARGEESSLRGRLLRDLHVWRSARGVNG